MRKQLDMNELFRFQMAQRYGKRVPRKLKKKFTITNKLKCKKAGIEPLLPTKKIKPAKTQAEYDRRKKEAESFDEFRNRFVQNISESMGIPVEILTQSYK